MNDAVAPRHSPSTSLLGHLQQELQQHAPFAAMSVAHLQLFLEHATQRYFAPGEVVLEPAQGPVTALLWVRRGSISGRKGLADATGPIEHRAGALFPAGALLAGRPVSATYTANEDTFCLSLPQPAVQQLLQRSAVFADFLNGRVLHFLALSRRAMQAEFAAQTLADQSLETKLAALPPKLPLTCGPDTPLAQALGQMHQRHVGSILVQAVDGAVQGILTRHDILGRITLPQLPLSRPISEVMSAPVQVLDEQATLSDAALLMSRHGVRHLPVLRGDRLVNIVTERDLFALQRQSLKQLSTALRHAADEAALVVLAGRIRDFARNLLGQGVHARQLTELVSHLNDLLTLRLVERVGERRGVDLSRACWLAFGSEGRSEQTIATDQDNGLAFASEHPERDRPLWLGLGAEVNDWLDRAGYPLCQGGVMAGNADCCLSLHEWAQRFERWIDHGAPQDLLNASIYFDLRPLAGQVSLVAPLLHQLTQAPARVPRFIKQLADNALRRTPPLNWRGGLDATVDGNHAWIDLKLQGTAMLVDIARLYALAHGLPQRSTRERLAAAAPLMGASAQEAQSWIAAFEYLQMLRLQVQLRGEMVHKTGHETGAPDDAPTGAPTGDPAAPNRVDVARLNQIDQRLLTESLRVVRTLQQRLALDYPG